MRERDHNTLPACGARVSIIDLLPAVLGESVSDEVVEAIEQVSQRLSVCWVESMEE